MDDQGVLALIDEVSKVVKVLTKEYHLAQATVLLHMLENLTEHERTLTRSTSTTEHNLVAITYECVGLRPGVRLPDNILCRHMVKGLDMIRSDTLTPSNVS